MFEELAIPRPLSDQDSDFYFTTSVDYTGKQVLDFTNSELNGGMASRPTRGSPEASGCWRSALGAGMPYNIEKNETKIYLFLALAHFLH